MKYLYGPVKSRRLGFSLGITLTPHKTCNFDCIYCQLGKTDKLASERKEYIRINDIVDELRMWLEANKEVARGFDFITLSGSGEPTLNVAFGDLISAIKQLTTYKVALLTNASLLADSLVRKQMLQADLIVPSLDAVTQELFVKIDRPDQNIMVENIINGLIALRREFRGKIWLEVMLVKGVNDDLRHIKKLRDAIEKINPDKIQINSPVRTTAEENVLSVARPKLRKIKNILGDKAEIVE